MATFIMDFLLKSIVAVLLIGFAFVNSSPGTSRYRSEPPSTSVNIKRKPNHETPLIRYQAQEDTGYYKFGYAVVDGQYRVEEGSPQDGILGSYGYVGTDGKEVKVFYKADSQGFQILTADEYKVLSIAKKRYRHQSGHSQPKPVQPGQDDYFYRNGQDSAKDIEDSDMVEVFNETIDDVFPPAEDDSKTNAEPETPEISINEHTMSPDNVQHQQPPMVFNQNLFPDRIQSSVPMFIPPPPPPMTSVFANHIPAYYVPAIRYENPFFRRRYHNVPSEIQRFTPLIIRVK